MQTNVYFPERKLMQNNQSVDDDDDEDDDDASMTDQLLMSPLKTKWAISIIIFSFFFEDKLGIPIFILKSLIEKTFFHSLAASFFLR